MILIITLNYNQNNYTLKCVESILNSENSNFSILIIDNGSELETFQQLAAKLPKDDRIIIKRIEQNRGYIGGINYGLDAGLKLDPDYFLIMNNDTILDKSAIGELVHTAQKYNQKAIVTGKVYHYDEPEMIQDIGYRYANKKLLQFYRIGMNEKDIGQYDLELERDMIDDVFWLFPNKLYQDIGGYSPFFWFNYEQVDFALRAKHAGYTLIYTPKAKLWHKGSVSIGGRELNPKQAYWTIQSSLLLSYLHLGKFNFTVYFFNTLSSVIRTTVKSMFFMLKGDRSLIKYASAKRKALLYFLKWLRTKNINTGESPF